jgi:hypothetical protein
MAENKIEELRIKAKEVLQKAKEQSKKLIEEAEQLEAQSKIKIANKAIEFYEEKISHDDLKNFIKENYIS